MQVCVTYDTTSQCYILDKSCEELANNLAIQSIYHQLGEKFHHVGPGDGQQAHTQPGGDFDKADVDDEALQQTRRKLAAARVAAAPILRESKAKAAAAKTSNEKANREALEASKRRKNEERQRRVDKRSKL